MSVLKDLIQQVDDPALRKRLTEEADKVTKTKKFGLVFEEHLPEYTPLYDIPVRAGLLVALKTGYIRDVYTVLEISGNTARCERRETHEEKTFNLDEIVVIAQFGEPIYPYLKPVDTVCNAPESDLWHTLIEADNYHALQLLEYLYAGKVDCIYIDPPYNTGAKDWKYNNNYVDGNDAYRHSKWLSMMEKRLKIAKKLLNPNDSVLIVTIDEKEYAHLACLLEDMFPEANIQMISSRINATGIIRSTEFTRVDEYIYYVMLGKSFPNSISQGKENIRPVLWHGLRRRDAESKRGTVKGGPAQFYPIYINNATGKIQKIGEPLSFGVDRNTVKNIEGCTTVFPLKPDGTEMNWGLVGSQLSERLRKGFVRAKKARSDINPYTIEYLTSGYLKDIESGKAEIVGYAEDGSAIVKYSSGVQVQATTQWNIKEHYAKEYGTALLRSVLGDKRFSYPKSVYAVKDCIFYFVTHKPNALILDFFAGSGTTLHAANLLNAEDGGHRRCILVTNNEVSEEETRMLTEQGHKPGDEKWEKYGIARYVTWPRTVCTIEGHDINGQPLTGNYIGSDMPMADGFKANAAFFSLGFLDKTAVALGMRFKKILPLLWMKAGAVGQCPDIEGDIPDMLVYPKNKFAVLSNENAFADFAKELEQHPEIETVFIVTDYEVNYRSMVRNLNVKNTYQLYRDYLDNFRINHGRD